MQIQKAVCSIAPELQSICDAGWHEENDIEIIDDDSNNVVRYVDLSNSRKKQLLLNCLALEIAVGELTDDEYDENFWLTHLKEGAECHLELMDKNELERAIVKMDLQHFIVNKEANL